MGYLALDRNQGERKYSEIQTVQKKTTRNHLSLKSYGDSQTIVNEESMEIYDRLRSEGTGHFKKQKKNAHLYSFVVIQYFLKA